MSHRVNSTQPPHIARLNTRLKLQRPQELEDDMGGRDIAWQDVAELWVGIDPVSGKNEDWHEMSAATVRARVWMRHRRDFEVRAGMRLVDPAGGERALFIEAVYDPDGRRRHLVALCEERPL